MKRILYALIAIVVVAGIGYFAFAWRPAIGAIAPPDPSSFSADVVERGRVLAGAGYCDSCHTKAGGPEYAGGYALETDFGTIYSTNITPDAEQGIGTWSEAAFTRAMRKGVSRDGHHLLPAFPYTHFAKMTDEDIGALYAYFMTREPAQTEIPANTLPFPYSLRGLQGGWKLLNFKGGEFVPDPDKSDAWNRGAYLAEGVGHCAACHSPRDSLGAERGGAQSYAGAVVDGWYAPAINATPDAALPWTADEFYAYLRNGASPLHGVAVGSMSEVVHDGLALLPDSDIEALATYLADRDGAPEAIPSDEIAEAVTRAAGLDPNASGDRGGYLFMSYCASCHLNRPDAPAADRPALALNSALTGPDPSTLIRVMIHGVSDADGGPDAYMPGFGLVLSDADIDDIVSYLRAEYVASMGGADPHAAAWSDLAARAQELRQLPK